MPSAGFAPPAFGAPQPRVAAIRRQHPPLTGQKLPFWQGAVLHLVQLALAQLQPDLAKPVGQARDAFRAQNDPPGVQSVAGRFKRGLEYSVFSHCRPDQGRETFLNPQPSQERIKVGVLGDAPMARVPRALALAAGHDIGDLESHRDIPDGQDRDHTLPMPLAAPPAQPLGGCRLGFSRTRQAVQEQRDALPGQHQRRPDNLRLARFELAAIPRLGLADLQQWDDASPKGLESLVKIEQGGGIGLHDRRSWQYRLRRHSTKCRSRPQWTDPTFPLCTPLLLSRQSH